jgi:hypothetical protein
MEQNDAPDLEAKSGFEADASVDRYSVGALVRRWLNPEDTWKLALVQRHAVWDEIRMKRLLDSLLAGYPIGTLLVCRVRQASKVLVKKQETRIAENASPGSWQLLDGQQRINAMGCIFSDKGHYGRFMVDMFARRYPDEIVARQRRKRETTKYIERIEAEGDGFSDQRKIRERYLDLSRWHRWAEKVGESFINEILENLKKDPRDAGLCIKILNEIDPAFADSIEPEFLDVVAQRTKRLLEIWTQTRIPVQKITLDSPQDVLQVFIRANLEGVRLSGEDVFFAAVKTIWNDAEENIDRVAGTTSLLNRMTSLRLLARLASRGISAEDLQPLRVDRLNPPKGQQIISIMQHLAHDEKGVLARIRILGDSLTSKSRLGYGLFYVNPMLFDHVFGWAAITPLAVDAEYLESQLQNIDTYLLGATAFQYPTVFLDTFARLGFEIALTAGSRNEPFPLQAIVTACKETWHRLRRGMRFVPADKSEEDHLALVNLNSCLFLSVLQNIPYTLPLRDSDGDHGTTREVEWDHLYAQALAKNMRVPDEKSGRLVHHPYRRLVWNAGNLWALDRPLNTSASDLPPSRKFDLLNETEERGLPSRWPSVENAFLTKEEERLLLETENLIGAQDVNNAMERFREFSQGRGLRLYIEIKRLFPDLSLFAPSEGGPQADYESLTKVPFWKELGLKGFVTAIQKGGAMPPGYSGFEEVFTRAEERGVKNELQAIVDVARELGLYARPYPKSVMITPRNNKTRMLFTIWPRRSEGGSFDIYRSSKSVVEFFPSISEEKALTLGKNGSDTLKLNDIPAFIRRLRQLFQNKSEGEK